MSENVILSIVYFVVLGLVVVGMGAQHRRHEKKLLDEMDKMIDRVMNSQYQVPVSTHMQYDGAGGFRTPSQDWTATVNQRDPMDDYPDAATVQESEGR